MRENVAIVITVKIAVKCVLEPARLRSVKNPTVSLENLPNVLVYMWGWKGLCKVRYGYVGLEKDYMGLKKVYVRLIKGYVGLEGVMWDCQWVL